MTKQYYKRSIKDVVVDYIPLGILDERGRVIGLRVSKFTSTFSLSEPGAVWGYAKPLPPFTLDIQVTRDCKTFGSSQPDQYFETNEAREAAILKRIKSTKARYLKKLAK